MRTATILVLVALIAIVTDPACAVSYPEKSQKPGFCPKLPPNAIGTCAEQCFGDGSCSGKMKCCSNGCGHVCKPPVFKADDSPVKVGVNSPKYG